MVFKKRQIVVLALILVIVVAGYMQYTYKKSSSASAQRNENNIGDAVFVDSKSDPSDKENTTGTGGTVNAGSDFFARAKLERQTGRSLSMDTLEKITEDENANDAVKAEAYDKMIKLVDITEKENKIEMLIKEKGYTDVVVVFGENGSMDIVVRAPGLTSAETAQIADIASRQGNVDISGIHIRNSI